MLCRFNQFLLRLSDSPKLSKGVAGLLLAVGLLLYLGVQGALMISPLSNWTLLPEADDTLTYVLKTRQMQECFFQDCPALNDLRPQLTAPSADPEVAAQRFLAFSRIFPVYHPLFSLVLCGLSALGPDLMGAYKLLWCLAPGIFAGAFAYLLITLFGVPVAGLALGLLAFKVFPDTGLHHLVPSNFTMALAVVLWARILQRQGDAPFSLSLGAVALVTLHPIGRIYSLMAGLLTLMLTGGKPRLRLWVALGTLALVVILAFLLSAMVTTPCLGIHQPPRDHTYWGTLHAIGQSVQQVVVDLVRFSGGLFGSFPWFCGAVALGWAVCARQTRQRVHQFLLVNMLFLILIFGYVSSHPADIFFRLWIPTVVVLFGLVGQGLWYALGRSKRFSLDYLKEPANDHPLWPRSWPLALLAVLLGYCLQMMVLGGEQIAATIEFVRQRQPLALYPHQPELLLSRAKPGDRVLYNSIIIMPYYFIHGALRLGAVYYHPALAKTSLTQEWLQRPDLRFAVTYNPLVYHPSFQGVSEHQWWLTSPEFRYSPLSRRQVYGPLAKEGKLQAVEFCWLEVAPQTPHFPNLLRLHLVNSGRSCDLTLVTATEAKGISSLRQVTVPAKWSGWLPLELPECDGPPRFRLELPSNKTDLAISGLAFGDDPLHWPWRQKARVTLCLRGEGRQEISVSFDPQHLLPWPLNQKRLTVLDDQGSSVLMTFD